MPQIPIEHTKRIHLYIWHIKESTEQLKNMLQDEKAVETQKFVSINHQKQFLAKQILFERYDLSEKVEYLPNGKPVCKNGRYISISHSGEYVVVAVSQEPVGIDIERKNPKLHRIASRFRHPDDVLPKAVDNLEQLQYLWTAKESIYKLAGMTGLSFKEDIRLTDFNQNNTEATAILKRKDEITLYYYKLEQDYLLCVVNYSGV